MSEAPCQVQFDKKQYSSILINIDIDSTNLLCLLRMDLFQEKWQGCRWHQGFQEPFYLPLEDCPIQILYTL